MWEWGLDQDHYIRLFLLFSNKIFLLLTSRMWDEWKIKFYIQLCPVQRKTHHAKKSFILKIYSYKEKDDVYKSNWIEFHFCTFFEGIVQAQGVHWSEILSCGSALLVIVHFSPKIMTYNKLSRSSEMLSHIKLQLSRAGRSACAAMLSIWNYVFLFGFVCISAEAALFDPTKIRWFFIKNLTHIS